MKKRPNIVLITLDSLRADFVGFQNPKENNTPFLDLLAKHAHIYKNAIAPGIPTFFSFPSLMLGKLPLTYGNYLGIPNKSGLHTIAEIVKAQGYDTYAYLADNPTLYSVYAFDRGFDIYNDGYEEANKRYLSSMKTLWNIRQAMPEAYLQGIDVIRAFGEATIKSSQHSVPGKKLNQKVKRAFAKRAQTPFFLWLHYMDTHLPYFSGLDTLFYKEEHMLQRTMKKIIFHKEIATSIRKMEIRSPNLLEITKEAYRSCVQYADEVVAEIMHFLKQHYSNTVFIITSDHGEGFMEHEMFGHEPFSLYNELIRIPLLIHIPGTKSKIITKPVSLVSLAKTIAAFAGVEELQFQGNNIVSDAVFSPINNISRILYQCRSPHVRHGILDNITEIIGYRELWSFTTPSEKYIVEEKGRIEEFFDLKNDPYEKHNLAGMIEKKKKYKALLKKYIEK